MRSAASFQDDYAAFTSLADKAVELSRQETVDEVEDRVGSRTVYTDQILPVLERLDEQHDELDLLEDLEDDGLEDLEELEDEFDEEPVPAGA